MGNMKCILGHFFEMFFFIVVLLNKGGFTSSSNPPRSGLPVLSYGREKGIKIFIFMNASLVVVSSTVNVVVSVLPTKLVK